MSNEMSQYKITVKDGFKTVISTTVSAYNLKQAIARAEPMIRKLPETPKHRYNTKIRKVK